MTTTLTCESCGMPIETGRYCDHCTDETGAAPVLRAAVRADAQRGRRGAALALRARRSSARPRPHGHHARLARSSPRHVSDSLILGRSGGARPAHATGRVHAVRAGANPRPIDKVAGV